MGRERWPLNDRHATLKSRSMAKRSTGRRDRERRPNKTFTGKPRTSSWGSRGQGGGLACRYGSVGRTNCHAKDQSNQGRAVGGRCGGEGRKPSTHHWILTRPGPHGPQLSCAKVLWWGDAQPRRRGQCPRRLGRPGRPRQQRRWSRSRCHRPQCSRRAGQEAHQSQSALCYVLETAAWALGQSGLGCTTWRPRRRAWQ